MATTDTLNNGITRSAYRFGNRPESTVRYATASRVYEQHEERMRAHTASRQSEALRISYQPLISTRWRKPSSLLLSDRDFTHLQSELQEQPRVLRNLAQAAERERRRVE